MDVATSASAGPGLLRGEADRLTARIDCLTRNRDAIRAYLAAIQPGRAPER